MVDNESCGELRWCTHPAETVKVSLEDAGPYTWGIGGWGGGRMRKILQNHAVNTNNFGLILEVSLRNTSLFLVSCILCHRGVQLILSYSWARPAIFVAGKGREVVFLFLLFLHFHSCSSFFPVPLFHLFCYLFCLFSPFLWETTQNDPYGLTCR